MRAGYAYPDAAVVTLPHVQYFCSINYVSMGGHRSIMSKFLDSGFEAAIEVIDISHTSIDGAAIADFLKNILHLRILMYSHKAEGNASFQDWDLCQFVMAIENEVVSHLEELSINISELHRSIVPKKISMYGFQNLQKLELPLEAAMCNLTSAASASCELLLSDLVPASVSKLSLVSHGKNHHEKALDTLFCDLAARKDDQVPALEKIYLSCPRDADSLYKEQCEKLAAETKKAGILLCLKS